MLPRPPESPSENKPNVPPAAVHVVDPSGQRTRVPIDTLPFLIGRQAENQLVLRDNRASRTHARIVAEDGHYVLEDLGSRHGIWVNGARVTRQMLRNGDRMDLGVEESYQMTFVLESGEFQRILEHMSSSSSSGGMGDNGLAKLRSLVEVARALQNSLSTKEVLTAVIDAALSVTGCERGFLLLRKDGVLGVEVARDREGRTLEADDLRVPASVIERALNSRRDLLSMVFDPLEESGARPESTVASLELRSVVCLPLIEVRSVNTQETSALENSRSTVGLVYMDSRDIQADLSGGSRELLQTLAMEASTILENARLIEDERDKQRMEGELKIAREIQQGLTPPDLPSSGWLRAAGSSWASSEVGGDYFDVRPLPGDRWAAVVADVSGKGVSSALLASFLQGAFLMASGGPAEIGLTMVQLNRFLLERTRGEKYATVFYCIIEASGRMYYVNAGHCAPYLVNADGRLRKLHTTGMPVGMLEEAEFQSVEGVMEPGDKIVLYSDGLTEAENADGQFFDAERVRLCLLENASASAFELHKKIMDAVDVFTEGGAIRDDITALVLEYTGKA